MKDFFFLAKLATGGFAVERPVDLGTGAIHPPIPCASFGTQSLEVGDPSGTETLTREQADFAAVPRRSYSLSRWPVGVNSLACFHPMANIGVLPVERACGLRVRLDVTHQLTR